MIRTAVYGDDRDLLAMRQGRGSGPRQERLADARTFLQPRVSIIGGTVVK
jgi:hypothetical protein